MEWGFVALTAFIISILVILNIVIKNRVIKVVFPLLSSVGANLVVDYFFEGMFVQIGILALIMIAAMVFFFLFVKAFNAITKNKEIFSEDPIRDAIGWLAGAYIAISFSFFTVGIDI